MVAQTGREVLKLGVFILFGSERHKARRIDNQLRGRCVRQGEEM
ncbi:MAG: hypothetical protein AB1630_10280 [bacterium]